MREAKRGPIYLGRRASLLREAGSDHQVHSARLSTKIRKDSMAPKNQGFLKLFIKQSDCSEGPLRSKTTAKWRKNYKKPLILTFEVFRATTHIKELREGQKNCTSLAQVPSEVSYMC